MGVKDGGKMPQPNNTNRGKGIVIYLTVIMLVTMLWNAFVLPAMMERQVRDVTYNEFLTMVDEGRVALVQRDVAV